MPIIWTVSAYELNFSGWKTTIENQLNNLFKFKQMPELITEATEEVEEKKTNENNFKYLLACAGSIPARAAIMRNIDALQILLWMFTIRI